MADKAISDLTQATQLGDNDLFVLEQNGAVKKMLMALWKDYISRNVVSASATQLPAGSQPTATFNQTNGALSLGIPKGDKGEPGESSAGYVSGIVKGDGSGGVSAAVAGTDYSVGASNRNLLDNPFFTVNQRGQSEYGGAIYGFDRWRGRNPSSFISARSAGGVELSGRNGQCYIAQYATADFLNNLRGKTVTLSVRVGDVHEGLFAARVSNRAGVVVLEATTRDGNKIISATGVFPDEEHITSARLIDLSMISAGGSVVVEAVKLELGSVSTLANDVAPNYAQELAKCQRYFQRHHENVYAPVLIENVSVSTYATTVVFPEMRVAPTLSFFEGGKFAYYDLNGVWTDLGTGSGWTVYRKDSITLVYFVPSGAAGTAKDNVFLSNFDLSADL